MKISEVFIFCFLKNDPLGNHEKRLFWHPLKTRAYGTVPVRLISKKLQKMVSKPPYDQMAPQLCQFYVPGQPSKRQFVKKKWSGGGYKKHRPDKRKVQIGPICIRF